MALSINPEVTTTSTTAVTSTIAGQVDQNLSSTSAYSNFLDKQQLNATISRLDGSVSSNYNGMTAGLTGINNLSTTIQSTTNSAVNTVNNAINTALNPISTVNNAVNNTLNSVNTAINTVTNLPNMVNNAVNQVTGVVSTIQETINTLTTIASTASVDGLASTLKSAMGSFANLMSADSLIDAMRSRNLPTDIPTFTQLSDIVTIYPVNEGDWRVRLNAPLGLGEIIFPVLPSFSLGSKANYTPQSVVHSNNTFMAYKNTEHDDMIIECDWPVETERDAADYLQAVLLGRTLVKMFYGTGPHVGQPPPICTLSGFATKGHSKLLPPMPVVAKSFRIDLNDEVSYVKYKNEYIPRMSKFSISLHPVYSRLAQRSFNLEQFRNFENPIKY